MKYSEQEIFELIEKCELYIKNDDYLNIIKETNKFSRFNKRIKTIATYYNRLYNGGIEIVITKLCKIWLNLGYNVILITDHNIGENDFELDSNVIRETLNVQNKISRVTSLKSIISKYSIDVMVYHDYGSKNRLIDFVTCKRLAVKFVLYCHGSINYYAYYKNFEFIHELVIFLLCCDAVIVLNEIDQFFYKNFNNNVILLTNPMDYCFYPEPIRETYNYILWIGRMDDDIKRASDLIEICKNMSKENIDFKFLIVGLVDKKFIKLVNKNHLRDYFEFTGYKKNPKNEIQMSKVLLSTSACECFPMNLVEAFANKKPVVMYDLPYLTLSKSKGVISVSLEDTRAAANELTIILKNQLKAKELGQINYNYIRNLIITENLEKKWDGLFKNTLKNRRVIVSNNEAKFLLNYFDYCKRIPSLRKKSTFRKRLFSLKNRLFKKNNNSLR